jgi:hypothetical protein
VTQYMNQFRRDGYLKYSRRGISLQHRALIEWQTAQPTATLRHPALTN